MAIPVINSASRAGGNKASRRSVHCIYAITNLVNGKRYVGSSVDFLNRKRQHIRSLNLGTHYNRHLQKAWKKYGEEAFGFSIVSVVKSTNDLLDCEQSWLDGYKPEYNQFPNARHSLGYKHTPETIAKLRLRPRTPETMAKITEARRKGGFKLSDEHKAALKRGRDAMSPDAKRAQWEAIGNAQIGRTVSVETRNRMSFERKGKPNLKLKGVPKTDEHRKALSDAANKRWSRPEERTKAAEKTRAYHERCQSQ